MGIRRIAQLFRAAALLWAASLVAISLWTALWPLERPLPQGDAIICLGAGVDAQGRVDAAGRVRAETCAELVQAGAAPMVLFSGGPLRPGLPSGAAGMAAIAMARGVAPSAILVEEASYSTLQNALFSLPMLPDGARLILVTEAFHLPRAWASFRVMGAEEMALVASERLRRDGAGRYGWGMILRESVAVWFNLARYGAWRLGGAVGVSDPARAGWLH